jgi:hypothetical protein
MERFLQRQKVEGEKRSLLVFVYAEVCRVAVTLVNLAVWRTRLGGNVNDERLPVEYRHGP